MGSIVWGLFCGYRFNAIANNADDRIRVFFADVLPFNDGTFKGKAANPAGVFDNANGQGFIEKIVQWANN